jgi:hypothetical protein
MRLRGSCSFPTPNPWIISRRGWSVSSNIYPCIEKVIFDRLIKNIQMQVEQYEIPLAGAPKS